MVDPFVLIEMPDAPTRLDVAGALIVIVPPFAPVACDSEIGLDPTNTILDPVTPVSPAVFPPVDTPIDPAEMVWLNVIVPPFASVL
jgi:hypothetical protein